MSEEPAPVYQFLNDGDGLTVSVGGVEKHFLRDADRQITISVTDWRTIVQSTDFRKRQDGAPTLLSHRLRAEAVGKLKGQKIEFINGGPESTGIAEFPIDIRQYDLDEANSLKSLRDTTSNLQEIRGGPTEKFYAKPHTAVLHFDPNDVNNQKYHPSTFLTVYVSKELMDEFYEFTKKNKSYEINFYLKFFNIYSQIGKDLDGKIAHSPLAVCEEFGNNLYGDLTFFSLKSVEEHNSSDVDIDGSPPKKERALIKSGSANLHFHQTIVQQNLQKMSETLTYMLCVLCIGLIVMFFK